MNLPPDQCSGIVLLTQGVWQPDGFILDKDRKTGRKLTGTVSSGCCSQVCNNLSFTAPPPGTSKEYAVDSTLCQRNVPVYTAKISLFYCEFGACSTTYEAILYKNERKTKGAKSSQRQELKAKKLCSPTKLKTYNRKYQCP